MDDFRIKLAEQVNKFTTQALEVDERDRQLIQQRDRALKLDETSRRLKQNATARSHPPLTPTPHPYLCPHSSPLPLT